MKSIFLSKIEPQNNTFRFYRIVLPVDSKALLIQWGRIGEYLTERWEQHESNKAALKALESTQKKKVAKGYMLTDERVLPKNYLLNREPGVAVQAGGQLSFLDEIDS